MHKPFINNQRNPFTIMTTTPIHIGPKPWQAADKEITGNFELLNGEEFYKISNYDQMRPFFISVVSHSEHWLFIATTGGLSAGRKNAENALFPYYTDDKIQDSGDLTGSKTILLVEKEQETFLWEPFSDKYEGIYQIERNLYKNLAGNRIVFEEINRDLSLSFTYSWGFGDRFGFIKKSQLKNLSEQQGVKVRVLDGLQNILPFGIDLKLQTERSTLLDAYKKNELLEDSGLGLFLLSSIPVDKAEPSEALKATTVWQTGLDADIHLLCNLQLPAFRKGLPVHSENDIRAERGAYLVASTVELAGAESKSWYFAAELNQGPSAVTALDHWIKNNDGLVQAIEVDMKAGTERLMQIVASADGLQKSADKMLNYRHFANVLFNVMRGGVFNFNYEAWKIDLHHTLLEYNHAVVGRNAAFFEKLSDKFSYQDLLQSAADTGDIQFYRLCLEYLPLIFSRRHGDPSRPWNQFSIELADEWGFKKFYYEGNWRDIFQNWEALAVSFPYFIESMITKFVNASTPDGYNPYRITSNGIDWEVIEPDDPWSYIGYWGDHQIIYLLKLLELSKSHHPGKLEYMLKQKMFSYANVPYRIRDYEALLADPQDTVDFDHELEKQIEQRVEEIGADGKLVWNKAGEVYLVNFTEKILVTLLAKLSNFIPEGGIWLNTQRPEWNDANNALVGNGVSMVTLYYIRRFVTFCQTLFEGLEDDTIEVSEEVATLLHAIANTFDRYITALEQPVTDQLRRQITDELGKAGALYRNQVYRGFSEQTARVEVKQLHSFFRQVLAFADHSIRKNKRTDNLYHAYNLMRVESDGGISIRYLYPMLEGQVGVLSAGLLTPSEALEVLEALPKSSLYREDQHSYLLYPDRQLPRFEHKNKVPEEAVMQSSLLKSMVEKGDWRIIEKDVEGQYHFNGSFNNQKDLEKALNDLYEKDHIAVDQEEKEQLLALFESIFDHASFTGRSGTFFGYEGLGCIYWHMVSKLVLAAEENCQWAIQQGVDDQLIAQLIERYYDVRGGIGFNKTPENYGAFPFDPYSHTPGNAGAQQPGMTGQVKEDILSRFGELGVKVVDSQIAFKPRLLDKKEFLTAPDTFIYYDIHGARQAIDLPKDALAFTYCQVPVIYRKADDKGVTIYLSNGDMVALDTPELTKEWSTSIMGRKGEVSRVEVGI